jgi:lysophospholipase L1-like esterase
MKIAFIGDSLTAGKPGVGYFDIVRKKLAGHELINMGRGGDSVISLTHRVRKSGLPGGVDIAVLEVGINDVFIHVSGTFLLFRKLMRQPWAKDLSEFECAYKKIMEYLCPRVKMLIIIPPLFLGEDPESRWTQEVDELARAIKKIAAAFENAIYLDARSIFLKLLKSMPSSGYIANSVFRVSADAAFLKSVPGIDRKSKGRGLHFTLDGIHLNSAGAGILAGCLVDMLRKVMPECLSDLGNEPENEDQG